MGSRTIQVPRPSKPIVSGSSPLGRAPLSLHARFQLFVDSRNPRGCWPWIGRFSGKYGALSANGESHPAHRLAWEIANGKAVPRGVVIRHACNHPWCVNPKHLRAGTQGDNMRDKLLSGRTSKGSKNGRAKLTEDLARVLQRRMAKGERKTDLAAEYGVSRRALRFLESGKNWAHIHARPEQQELLGGAA